MSEVTPDAVYGLIKKLLVEEFDIDPEIITLDATLESLDVDSLDLVELVKTLEDEFGVTIHDEELKPIASVGDAVTLVLRLDAERASA